MKNLIVFKLMTGEEIIAEVVDDLEYQVRIKNAIMLILTRNPREPADMGISGVPWGMNIEEDILINEEHILYSGTPTKNLVDMYERAFSNLDLPPAKRLITG